LPAGFFKSKIQRVNNHVPLLFRLRVGEDDESTPIRHEKRNYASCDFFVQLISAKSFNLEENYKDN